MRQASGTVGQQAPGSIMLITRDGEQDAVAVEEPLEIRVEGEPVAVTMRTPGDDEQLALGFLFGEGLIDSARAVSLTDDLAANTVEVAGPLLRRPASRRFYTTSSCGVCGKGAIEEVAVHAAPPAAGWSGAPLSRPLLASLPDRLVQPGFKRTGGLHATGLFDSGTELVCVREDVGRHNAMDKVIGWALQDERLPLADCVLCVSGRLSFELVQKAVVAGAPVLIGVGAPTSLAVSLAREYGLTLGGFARGERINIYSGADRLQGPPGPDAARA
jgi:FdhD protein